MRAPPVKATSNCSEWFAAFAFPARFERRESSLHHRLFHHRGVLLGVKEDPNHQLGSEVAHAFATMKVAAEGLCATSAKSALAGDLDSAIKEMSVANKVSARDSRRGEIAKVMCSEDRQECTRKQATCVLGISRKTSMTLVYYPSPDLSHSSLPAVWMDGSLANESEDEEDISIPSLASRKRRLLPSESA